MLYDDEYVPAQNDDGDDEWEAELEDLEEGEVSGMKEVWP